MKKSLSILLTVGIVSSASCFAAPDLNITNASSGASYINIINDTTHNNTCTGPINIGNTKGFTKAGSTNTVKGLLVQALCGSSCHIDLYWTKSTDISTYKCDEGNNLDKKNVTIDFNKDFNTTIQGTHNTQYTINYKKGSSAATLNISGGS